MKDTIIDDYLFEKRRIEFHCDEIINTIRLHGDLVFKTEKGKKFKEKLIRNCNDIKNILERKLEEFFKADHDYRNFKHKYSTQEVIIHDLEKDHLEQEVATYNKSNNRFYVDEFTYIDTETKLINAWYKTINYKKD